MLQQGLSQVYQFAIYGFDGIWKASGVETGAKALGSSFPMYRQCGFAWQEDAEAEQSPADWSWPLCAMT